VSTDGHRWALITTDEYEKRPEKVDDGEFIHKELTHRIIGAAFAVHNALGCGFLEKVYENALIRELQLEGVTVETQKSFTICYRGIEVGTYVADLVVNGTIIVEVKALDQLADPHRAQLLNYLRISGLRLGLLLNFGTTKVQYERLIC